jgi:hypothetical protein
MNDRDWLYLSGTVIALAVLWYAWSHRAGAAPPANPSEQIGALPVGWDDPMTSVYAANPAAYQPATPGSLTLNIANQSPSILDSQYMPLFGFVGIAQGAMFQ